MSGRTVWQAPGPVAQAFLEATDLVAVLLGPVGGGKTVTGLMRGVFWSYGYPAERDGVRRVKGAVIRRTYVDLWSTTIPSWWAWFPQSLGTWTGGQGGPASHVLTLRHPADGGLIELTVQFIGLGDRELESAMRGWEGSWVYVDEIDLLDRRAPGWLFSRTGRHRLGQVPVKPPGAVWGTCNAPDVDHWIFADFIERPRDGYRLFRQPSGLSPDAENIRILGPSYYPDLVRTMSEWEVRRFVRCEFGPSRDGQPVYPEFNDRLHMSETPLEVLPGRTLVLGLDAGGTPAAAGFQRAANGQWRGLFELATDGTEVVGPTRFGELLAVQLAEKRFRGLRIEAYGDPSAAWGADTSAGEASWLESVGNAIGQQILPAPTNAAAPRIEALRLPLARLIDGRLPGLILDPSMRQTRGNLASRYRYSVTKGERGNAPMKNHASHLTDAEQYALLGGGEYAAVMGRRQVRAEARRPVIAATSFNPI